MSKRPGRWWQGAWNRFIRSSGVGRAGARTPSARRLSAEPLEARTLLAVDAQLVAVASSPHSLLDFNGALIYADGASLFKASDTPSSPILLKEFLEIDLDFPARFGGNQLLFPAKDAEHGWELWKTDGSPEGTVLVKDISPGAGGSNPAGLLDIGGTVYFAAADADHGRELWKTDGSPAGTVLVKDVLPGSSPSRPDFLTNVNGTLFFLKGYGAGQELWKSDGTEAGTVMVKQLLPVGSPGSGGALDLGVADGLLYFTVDDGVHGREMWRSDGTEAGTFMLRDINPSGNSHPGEFHVVQETACFTAYDPTHKRAIWRTDGTEAGTAILKDFLPAGAYEGFSFLGEVDSKLYVVVRNGAADSLTAMIWATDGTEAGTVLIKDFGARRFLGVPTGISIGGKLHFCADQELWTSDGTTDGTTQVREYSTTSIPTWLSPAVSLGSGALFTVCRSFDWHDWTQLWVTDGTKAGTAPILDTIGKVHCVGNTVYITGSNGIWRLRDYYPDEDTPGAYDPQTSVFYLRNSNTGGYADITADIDLENAQLLPLSGDLDGDGLTNFVLYDPATSTFYVRPTTDSGSVSVARRFGAPGAGWLPVIGDWNGDGRDTVGFYDSTTSLFYLTNYSDDDHPYADFTFGYGAAGAGWKPIAGDWDGDGFDSIGLYDPATSLFYLRNSNSVGYADNVLACGAAGAGWVPLAGDWNHDGTTTIGLYDPLTSLFFESNSLTSGYADIVVPYGAPGMLPVVGDWDALDGLPIVTRLNLQESRPINNDATTIDYLDLASLAADELEAALNPDIGT